MMIVKTEEITNKGDIFEVFLRVYMKLKHNKP